MLNHAPVTIPAETRDFPEWHHGRETYAVWILPLENGVIWEKFKAARQHLDGYLLKPYPRQPHITLFVCGFLVDRLQYNDDFTRTQLLSQMAALEQANFPSFEIEIGGLNSFASAPFLEVHDPEDGITRLREILANGAREFRTTTYIPHLTVGLYAGAYPSAEVTSRLAEYPANIIKWRVRQITLATYRADTIAGELYFRENVMLRSGSKKYDI